jgi:hypothetical protein
MISNDRYLWCKMHLHLTLFQKIQILLCCTYEMALDPVTQISRNSFIEAVRSIVASRNRGIC